MRKHLMILLGSIAVLLCWAGTDFNYRFWFNDDDANAVEGASLGDSVSIAADVEALANSVHFLHLQVTDDEGNVSAVKTSIFVKLPHNEVSETRYWFDSDIESAITLSSLSVTTAIDVSALPDGIHYLHVQGLGTEPTAVKTCVFAKLPRSEVREMRYWFDSDIESAITLNGLSVTADIDVSALTDGIHYLHVQGMGNPPSAVKTSLFVKMPTIYASTTMTCVASVDGEPFASEVIAANGGVVHYDLPLKDISQGLHMLSVALVTESGAITSSKSCYFLRHPTANEISEMRCCYVIDGTEERMEAGTFDNGDFHFDVDVENLTDGLHNISYMLVLANGSITDIHTAFFVKTPLGGNGIHNYCYWLNDATDKSTKVDVAGHPAEVNITDLIPVESMPLRTSSFHFEFDKSGEPWIYARNDFHIRFYSADGRFGESTATYTDYATSRKVEGATALSGSGKVTKAKPANGEIHWYTFDAEIGDSIAMRTDMACTLQLFSPTGDEVYSAKDYDATKTGGIHAYENGNYYLALHDANGSGANLTLQYEQIDRYAVLGITPNVIGAATGHAHIKLFGNGYDKLENAILRYGGTEIWVNDIEVTSPSDATLEFYIPNDEVPLGKYDLALDFSDAGEEETVTISEAVTMAEAEYGDIRVNVTSHRSVAKPYPVTVTVTNTGNVEHQMIPLFVGWEAAAGIEEFYLMNAATMLYDTDNERNPLIVTDNLLDKGVDGLAIPLMIPSLAGGESVDIVVGYVAQPHTRFDFYAWAYQPWSLSGSDEVVNGAPRRSALRQKSKAPQRDNPLCSLDPCSEIGNVVPQLQTCLCQMAWGNISMLSGAHLAHYNKWSKQMNAWIAAQGMDEYIDNARYPRIRLVDPNDILRRIGRDCLPTPEALESVRDLLDGMANDRCPDPQPHHVDVYMPGDPNDLLGYESPAGTRYIKRDLVDLSYTVEFENDPEIANAAAHHIMITNKLDGSKLDLSTLKVKSIKLAHRNVDLSQFADNFVTTIDMRPEINSLAQLTQTFDAASGLISWDIQALDPMTLDPTDDVMQGILPVNDDDGRGIGEIIYDVSLVNGLPDGSSIKNSASITFDNEDPIETPVWENIIDSVLPESCVAKATAINGETIIIDLDGSDTRSGIWKYDIYMRLSEADDWSLLLEGAEDSSVTVNMDIRNINSCSFCCIAYDKADNMEEKELAEEAKLDLFIKGDANNDGIVSIADYTVIINQLLGRPNDKFFFEGADVDSNGIILISDATSVINMLLGNSAATEAPARLAATPAEHIFSLSDMSIGDDYTGISEISIAHTGHYTSLQADITHPAGLHLAGVALAEDFAESHRAEFREIAPGVTRIVVYSPENATITDHTVCSLTFIADAEARLNQQTMHLTKGLAVECVGASVVQHVSAPASAMIDATTALSVAGVKDMTVTTDDLTIIITTEVADEVIICDVQGHAQVYSLTVGVNRIKVPAPGAYFVNDTKIIVN